MDYEVFAADLPSDRRITFTSVEENEEELRRLGVKQEMRQLGSGIYRCDLAIRSMEGCELFSDRFNKPILMHLEPPPDTVGFLFPRSVSGKFLASGKNVGSEKLLFFPEGSGADITIPALAGSEAFLIPEQRFIEISQALCPAMDRPESLMAIGGNTAQLHLLRRSLADLVAHREPDSCGDLSVNLIDQTIAWMGDSTNFRYYAGIKDNSARIRVARLAREFIEEHYWQTVRLEDLCRVTGVGIRSLQRAFRDYFGATITDYLKAVRLNEARRELASADPSSESVARIALKHGFTHLGRFSIAFRECFGESPRKTLARYESNLSASKLHRF